MTTETAVRRLPQRKLHTVPVRWRYGAEHDDVGEVVVTGYDAPRLVEDLQRLLELRDAVLGLTIVPGDASFTELRSRLDELRSKAKKLLVIDLPEAL